MSEQAIEFISKIPQIPFASWLAPYITSSSRIHKLRKQIEETAKPREESLIARRKLRVSKLTIADIPVVLIEPPTVKPKNAGRILFNIHGGAFCLGSARDRTGLLMASEMEMRVYSVEYTLAPEARYPVARNQCLAVYRKLVDQFGAENILCMSASSGCQLMMSMFIVAKREGVPLPRAQYLCTPATDFRSAGDSLVFNASRDIMPVEMLSEMVKQNYQAEGVRMEDPEYSPLFAEYETSFPPTVITTGTRDVLLSSSVLLYWRLREASVKVELLVSEGMWHGFDWEEEMPEAVRVRQAVRRFLEDY